MHAILSRANAKPDKVNILQICSPGPFSSPQRIQEDTQTHLFSGVPLRWGSLRCKSKFWARNFKFWARDVHPTISQAQVPLRRGSLRYGANRHSGREISNSGPEMCTPLFLRPKSKPAGREKPIRVAPIRVVTKSPMFSRARKKDFPFFPVGRPRPELSPKPSPCRLPFLY